MSVKNEPRLVPPLATPQAIFGTHETLESDHAGILEPDQQRQRSSEPHDNHDKNATPRRHVSHCNQERVSAWEDTLPRLGFGAIDFSSLLDYERRPKTPDDTILQPPKSPMRLPTPPDTPSDKKLSLAAGLDVAVRVSSLPTVDAESFSSATYTRSRTVTASALPSDDCRVQSTLQSSPPAPNSSSVAKANTGSHIFPRAESEFSSGLRGVVEKHNHGHGHPNDQEDSAPPLSPIGPQPLLFGPDKAVAWHHSSHRQDSKLLATPTFSKSIVNPGLDRIGHLGEHCDQSTQVCKSRSDNSHVTTKRHHVVSGSDRTHDSATQARGFDLYFEIMTAAVQSKPQLYGSPTSSIVSKETIIPAKSSSIAQAQVVTSKQEQPAGGHHHSGALNAGHLTPTSAKVPLDWIASTQVSLERQRGDKTRLWLGSDDTLGRKSKSLPINQSEEDVDDDEVGGCHVLSGIAPSPRPVLEQEPLLFSRNKPTLAEKATQDNSKARVHETASFNAQFRSIPRLAKEEKLDRLVRKLRAKELLSDDENVHVFVDMSNIFIGFQDSVKIRQGISPSARVTFSPISFELLAFVLERGRTPGKRMLAGSVRHAQQMNNLPAHILEAKRYGFETKILHQVTKLEQPKLYPNSPYTSGEEGYSGVLCPRTKLGEQGVDEALHLAMQDSILDGQGDPGTMVLATGDAKPAEYSDGFAHYAIKALKHGWRVEVISWRKCLSGEWKKSPFKDKYASQFRIILLDDYLDEIIADWAAGPSAILARV